MSRVRGKNTRPEIALRRLIHLMGFRYRLHGRGLPGKPDLVFASRRKAIFLHGCFWHRHENCALARLPKSRLDFWLPKLDGNRERDRRVQGELLALGWDLLVVWECELRDGVELRHRIQKFLGKNPESGGANESA
jgi:DNA mismatch endonuclease (patch repair protein)